jgi:toxin-antitoxin system PIN domain toxin
VTRLSLASAETAGAGLVAYDQNSSLALAWPNHTHHRPARRWFDDQHARGWATTPVTECGFVRMSSNRAAIKTSTSPAVAVGLLERMVAMAGHEFWPDDLALVTGAPERAALIASHRDVTDAHLLALADRHGGRLVSFDSGLSRLLGHRDKGILQVLAGPDD